MPENSALCDVSRGHTHRSALADICAQHDYTALNHPSSSALSQVLQRPSFNFRCGGGGGDQRRETNSLDVLWHFGVNLSERSEGSKGEVVISAGTDGCQSNRLVFDNKHSGVARRGSERRQVTEHRCPPFGFFQFKGSCCLHNRHLPPRHRLLWLCDTRVSAAHRGCAHCLFSTIF